MQNKTENVLLVDGMNTFIRSFTTIKLINKNDQHIGGLVGFLKSLGMIISKIRPTKVIIVWEGYNSHSKRRYIYPNYKKNRGKQTLLTNMFGSYDEMQESKNDQLERLVYYLSLLPVIQINEDNLEADDIIAYLSNKYSQDPNVKKVTIYSADHDFYQLINDKVTIFSPIKKQFINKEQVINKYNVHPNNFLLYKTLMGDTSDNIEGVQGLGPKGMTKLFPELLQEQKLDYSYIQEKSFENKDSKVCNRILNLDNILKINYKVMDLDNPLLNEDEIESIEEKLQTQKGKLQMKKFIQAWEYDLLGRSIPNVAMWLSSNFGMLR